MEAIVLCYDPGWEFSLRDARLEGVQLVPRKARQPRIDAVGIKDYSGLVIDALRQMSTFAEIGNSPQFSLLLNSLDEIS